MSARTLAWVLGVLAGAGLVWYGVTKAGAPASGCPETKNLDELTAKIRSGSVSKVDAEKIATSYANAGCPEAEAAVRASIFASTLSKTPDGILLKLPTTDTTGKVVPGGVSFSGDALTPETRTLFEKILASDGTELNDAQARYMFNFMKGLQGLSDKTDFGRLYSWLATQKPDVFKELYIDIDGGANKYSVLPATLNLDALKYLGPAVGRRMTMSDWSGRKAMFL